MGPAWAAIAGLRTTAASYDEAVNVFLTRFGDKRQIEDHLAKLRALTSMTN